MSGKVCRENVFTILLVSVRDAEFAARRYRQAVQGASA
jgi:hypothetical protein